MRNRLPDCGSRPTSGISAQTPGRPHSACTPDWGGGTQCGADRTLAGPAHRRGGDRYGRRSADHRSRRPTGRVEHGVVRRQRRSGRCAGQRHPDPRRSGRDAARPHFLVTVAPISADRQPISGFEQVREGPGSDCRALLDRQRVISPCRRPWPAAHVRCRPALRRPAGPVRAGARRPARPWQRRRSRSIPPISGRARRHLLGDLVAAPGPDLVDDVEVLGRVFGQQGPWAGCAKPLMAASCRALAIPSSSISRSQIAALDDGVRSQSPGGHGPSFAGRRRVGGRGGVDVGAGCRAVGHQRRQQRPEQVGVDRQAGQRGRTVAPAVDDLQLFGGQFRGAQRVDRGQLHVAARVRGGRQTRAARR